MAEPYSYSWEFDHGEEVCGEFFVARGDTAQMSDLVEESLHQIAFFIEIGIECAWRLAVVCGGAKVVHGSGGIFPSAGGAKLCHL